MDNTIKQKFPETYQRILIKTEQLGFTMASDPLTGSLLRTLATSKRDSILLELGTGTGLATSWILDGIDSHSTLTSIDNDPTFLEVAKNELGADKKLHLVFRDCGEWIRENRSNKYDFIFADTWYGKFLLLDETLNMLDKGALYIIDDMLPQPDWPDGHSEKVNNLISYLDAREDLLITKQVWATGIIIASKR